MKKNTAENRQSIPILEANKRFEAKLSQKRREALSMISQIKDFIYDQTGEELPTTKKELLGLIEISESWNEIYTYFRETINFYYTQQNAGLSIAHIEFDGKEFKTFTVGHMYSKNRLCPVWNWRKSQLIRKKYSEYLKENQLWKDYHPVHLVLTVPHDNKGFEGQRFYGEKVIYYFNLLRKDPFWKTFVFAGEYGLETKKSKDGKNLHIHIHSFVLLKKGRSVNLFRAAVKNKWEKLTGGNQIWAETLYFYEKDSTGKPVLENKKKKVANPFEAPDGMYEMEETEIEHVVRKKIYVDAAIKEIMSDQKLTREERDEKAMNTFLSGVMECIKYHFKQDTMYMDGSSKMYDVFLISEILEKTKGKRLYSRFGEFYSVKELNFNKFDKKEDTEISDDLTGEEENVMSKSASAISPFTGEPVPIDKIKLVMFKPEKRKYNSRYAVRPFESIEYDLNVFIFLDLKDIAEAVKSVFCRDVIKPDEIENDRF